jgi:hypothetical protein
VAPSPGADGTARDAACRAVTGSLPADGGLALVPLLQRAGRDIESTIQGRSMGATLPPGTRILIQCRTDGAYPDGCVVAFVASRGLVGHRVAGRGSDRGGRSVLLTRGDGTVVCDPPLEPDRVLGEVTKWHDGHAWRPVPPAPASTAGRRLCAAGLMLLIRATLVLDRGLAADLAEAMALAAQRLVPRDPVPSQESAGDGRV